MLKKDLKKCTEFLEDCDNHQPVMIIAEDEGEIVMQFAGVDNPNDINNKSMLLSLLIDAAQIVNAGMLVQIMSGKKTALNFYSKKQVSK